MAKFKRRAIYIDDETWERVRALARHRLQTASELIRGLIAASFGEDEKK